ncbi:MAG: Co/Zn/Cd efflux system component [Candidatus Midichloria mitochondrii]|uniref:Cation diffusion facilitator family transporter n=1 Tax=Midichloria mitochondrii (strain IricVA) TaxID=696127 RepID=F7XTS8_MIDMI|nr:cation diffusion facilitator family transporter [Candidatus Midichloria mitochondrii]AEI89287.1 cation diffusion facilitator family transporter [Candidatus Midichloria mitochondrii IricVA]MDJ1256416.1 cation diffusion facilitator family transporter [Candidatus Midichloria mitochondrii]MDJ1288134.1 cation diffusion facilitator family transporter [Candidatus Midichloria mitochondrii]MDJ1298983.1 cation diffusion facilitator family transporter [Candidatus Midichloria mitochondrii]MDJ1313188.1 
MSFKHQHKGNINNKFITGIVLNTAFIIIELVYGVLANSLALVADAIHNAADVLSLFLSWFSFLLARKKAPEKFTYGYKNLTIFATFINAILLFLSVGAMIWESFERLGNHETVNSGIVILVAFGGVIINGLSAFLFFDERRSDINIEGAFLHLLSDILVSVGVIVAGFFIWWRSWYWIDSVMGLLAAIVIMISSWKLFKESLNLILGAIPAAIDLEKLKIMILQSKGLVTFHDLHIWPISTTETALSVHLVVLPESFNEEVTTKLEESIKNNFPIHHVTMQLEKRDNNECPTDCALHQG